MAIAAASPFGPAPTTTASYSSEILTPMAHSQASNWYVARSKNFNVGAVTLSDNFRD
jgi:hypothetical protein